MTTTVTRTDTPPRDEEPSLGRQLRNVNVLALLGLAAVLYFLAWVLLPEPGFHLGGIWFWVHLALWITAGITLILVLLTERSGRTGGWLTLLGTIMLIIMALALPAFGDGNGSDNGEVDNDPAKLIADLVENACPNGVDDTTNWPELADTDFALAAGPSLLGKAPSEILSSWYGEDGRGCTQAAKELQATVALRAADVGLDDGQFINQLRPRFLNENDLWEESVDATAPIFSNLLANEYREEVVFKDRDAYCVTVLNDHTVIQVEAVFINPVSGFEGLPSLPESVEEGPHVWFLPAYDIFCREAPFENVPVQEGVVELGKEAEEERVAAEEEVAEVTTTTTGAEGATGTTKGPGTTEDTAGGPGTTEGVTGTTEGPGGPGTTEGPTGTTEGPGGGEGTTSTTEGPGGEGTTSTTCVCTTTSTTVPDTTTTTKPPSTTTSTTVPDTTTTTKPPSTTTTTVPPTTTTTLPPTTTTTTVPVVYDFKPYLRKVSSTSWVLELQSKSGEFNSFSPAIGSTISEGVLYTDPATGDKWLWVTGYPASGGSPITRKTNTVVHGY